MHEERWFNAWKLEIHCRIRAVSLSLGWAMHAATYVYVLNAEDGTIGMYTMENDGTLKPGAAIEAGKLVTPMNVSPDKRTPLARRRSELRESAGSARSPF
jgi:hypothetical protein